MQKKQIEHSFRNISIDYDESKPWTPRDEKLLKLYIQLHDNEAQRHQQAYAFRVRFTAFAKDIEAVRSKLNAVNKKLTTLREAADHIIAQANLKVPNAIEQFVKQTNTTSEAILEYDKQFRPQVAMMNKLIEALNKYEDEDDETNLWERLMELKITYVHDSRLSIDYVSFDDEEERFRIRTDYMSRQNDKHVSFCNTVMADFNLLRAETETLYEVWKEFGSRLKLIEHITGMNKGFSGN